MYDYLETYMQRIPWKVLEINQLSFSNVCSFRKNKNCVEKEKLCCLVLLVIEASSCASQ